MNGTITVGWTRNKGIKRGGGEMGKYTREYSVFVKALGSSRVILKNEYKEE